MVHSDRKGTVVEIVYERVAAIETRFSAEPGAGEVELDLDCGRRVMAFASGAQGPVPEHRESFVWREPGLMAA